MVNSTDGISREDLLALMQRPEPMSDVEQSALERLLCIGKGDTGQSRLVANFLLAWWNAETCGGFDLTDLWGVDSVIASDIVTIFTMVARVHSYPDSIGYAKQFGTVLRGWRPELVKE